MISNFLKIFLKHLQEVRLVAVMQHPRLFFVLIGIMINSKRKFSETEKNMMRKRENYVINIALYIADTRPSGITRYAINMSRCLSKYEYKCKIIVDTNLMDYESIDFVIISPDKTLSKFNVFKRILALKKHIEINKIDIIISNGWYHDMLAVITSRIVRKKVAVIGVVHTRPQLWNLNGSKLHVALKKSIIKMVYKKEDATISVSKSLASLLSKDGWVPNIQTIYNPIVSKELMSFSKVRENPKEFVRLCCLGWINPIKGLDIAVNALSEVLKEFPASLTIIGDVNDSKYLEQIKAQIKKLEIDNFVTFTGPLEDPFTVLDEMDIFLLPSRSEALPTVLVEAMAIGLPVVACDCEFGPREILHNGKFGMLVAVDDYQNMAKEIYHIATDSKLYGRLSQLGIQRALQFDFNHCSKEYDRLIGNVLSKKR